MKLPSIAILLLRGLEGCGVTSYARHTQAFFRENNATCDIFVMKSTKKVGRPETSKDLDCTIFKFDKAGEVVDAINAGSYDLTMVFSVPSKTAGEEIVENYVDTILNRIKTRKVFINHDHATSSFIRNADYKAAIEACDITLCHSLKKTPKGFLTWMETNEVNVPVDKLDVFFHVPFVSEFIDIPKEQRVKRVICASRYASWKRTELTFRLHEFNKKRGFITEVIGYERSLKAFQFLDAFQEMFDFFTCDDIGNGKACKRPSHFPMAHTNDLLFDYLDANGQTPDLIYSIGPYVYKRGLSRIAHSAFAVHGRTFEANGLDYGNNMEYQTIECSLLAVPIVHRHFLTTATIPGTDTPLMDTGLFLSIDDDKAKGVPGPSVINGEELLDEMEDIWDNSYDERRKDLVQFIKDHYSTEAMLPAMLERCL